MQGGAQKTPKTNMEAECCNNCVYSPLTFYAKKIEVKERKESCDSCQLWRVV